MKKNIDVEILGHKYTIRSDQEETHVLEITEYLNKKIDEVLQSTNTIDTLKVVILAALNITGELFHTKNEHMALEQQIEDTSRRLINFIDCQMETEEQFLNESLKT